MNIEISGINGAKLFELDPELFDMRLGGSHNRVTKKQREEYLDSLRCVLCGRVGGSCDCTHQKEEREKEKVETKTINLSIRTLRRHIRFRDSSK
jgi:hypothetical protein